MPGKVKKRINQCTSFQNLKFIYQQFPRYKEIQKWLLWLAKKFPHMVKVEKIGCSVQKRDIYMIIIKGCEKLKRISVMLEAGIHAREWITITTALYCISYIVRHPDILKFTDFYIIPCLNPDGYEFTHTDDRLWRKNMNHNNHKLEHFWGVDLNRNFPYGYGLAGSSSSPTSAVYHGKHSLSEPEARALANALYKYGNYVQLYIAIHAHGNLIMYPWGYTYRPIEDEDDLRECGEVAICEMKEFCSKSKFEVGQLSEVMYISSGGSSDYARGTHGIKFSYTFELHRGGRSGFEPRRSRIDNIAKETFAGIMAMTKFVHKYYCERKYRKRKRCQSNKRRPCKRPRME